jgi:AraC family transcriptional regulator, regulatory protein of adaptative response / DNA-3-methyladenine glycosylase II
MTSLTAVKTTGIYCRPGCGAKPLARNTQRYDLAAAAEAAGYRACLRCRPYRTSQHSFWTGPEVVCKGVQMILLGGLDSATEAELAAKLGVSARHLRRLFQAHLGVTPTELARSSRAHFARRLLDDTDLSVTEIAFASGFGSVRQLNRTCREIFRSAPSELRARRRRSDRLVADGGLALRLPHDGHLDWRGMLDYFAPRAIPGVEHVSEDTYRRTVLIEDNPGVIEVMAGDDHLIMKAHLPRWGGLIHIAQRTRSIFGLDSGVEEGQRHLGEDPTIGPLIARNPGIRVPGVWDPFEIGVRAIIGQGITVAGATTITGKLVEKHGSPVPGLAPMGLTHLFPTPSAMTGADLTGLGLTGSREEAIRGFSKAVLSSEVPIDGTAGLSELVAAISSIPGIGPWTANYIALRMGEPDAFPDTDLGLQRAYDRISDGSETTLAAAAEAWRPWRSLAAIHLWVGDIPPNA